MECKFHVNLFISTLNLVFMCKVYVQIYVYCIHVRMLAAFGWRIALATSRSIYYAQKGKYIAKDTLYAETFYRCIIMSTYLCMCVHRIRTIIWRIITLRIYDLRHRIILYVILDKIPPFSEICCSRLSYACALHQHDLLPSLKKTKLLYAVYCSSCHPYIFVA